jgi:hypothetical protein
MKKIGLAIILGVCFSLFLFSGAMADGHYGWHGGGGWHGGWHGGFYGWYGPWYPYGYPYYYPYAYPYAYPSTEYPSASVPVPSEPQQSYWYYCRDSKAYYPYVTSCPSGWVPVVPTPPPSGREGGAQ